MITRWRGLTLAIGTAALASGVAGCGDRGQNPVGPGARGVQPARFATATANDRKWWAGLSAQQRGQLIVAKATSYVGSKTFEQRCNCKEAVRRWAAEASRNVVQIPSTKANNYEWEASASVSQVTNSAAARKSASVLGAIIAGDMVQMALPTKPYLHTLVVESVTSSSITVVEANYVGCAVTRGRVITFSDLLNTKKVSNFTVYRAN